MASKTTTSESPHGSGQTPGQSSSIGQSGSQQTSGSQSASRQASSLDEALRTLDRAIVENREELQSRLSSDFQDLKSALSQIAPRIEGTFRQYKSRAVSAAQNISQQGLERSRVAVSTIDTQVHANPWPYIGGVAIGFGVLGFLLGRSGRDSEMEYNAMV